MVGRTRRRWDEHVKIYFRQIGCEGLHWIQMALGSAVLNLCCTLIFSSNLHSCLSCG